MQSKPLALASLLLAALVAFACVTINVYFPEAAVKDLSEKIEDAVAREAETVEGSEEPQGEGTAALHAAPESWLRSTVDIAVGNALRLLAPAPVYAQEGDVAAPEITNPAIRQIIQSRAKRVKELNGFKASGAVGENNEALVEVRQLDALPLQQRAAVQKLVRAENSDRERMFKEIAAATGTDLSQLPQIRSTYATTLRQKAKSGDWIQMPDGSWKQK
ncbi:MAG: DUF1318 domain-containing protein [Acidobacteriota bacterium]